MDTWRGIVKARELQRMGIEKRIGNGQETGFLQAYKSTQFSSSLQARHVLPSQWSAPSPGLIKLNFDAAFPLGDSHQIALVARDGKVVLGWAVRKYVGRPAPVVGEARAALFAAEWALSHGRRSIMVECDNI